jgi:hypothetical protein
MPKVYERPKQHIPVPAFVVQRRVQPHWQGPNFQRIPNNRVPLEKRSGVLEITYVAGDLVLDSEKAETVYPLGVNYHYRRSCEVKLEVLPRGKSPREYAELAKSPPFIQRMALVDVVRTIATPLVLSRNADVSWDEVGMHTDAHVTLVRPEQFRRYLPNVLPVIGVDPRDVQSVFERVSRLLEQGRRRL